MTKETEQLIELLRSGMGDRSNQQFLVAVAVQVVSVSAITAAFWLSILSQLKRMSLNSGMGKLTGIAGLVLGSELRVGQSTVGPDFLLPAFAGALPGATSVRPQRVNVWGTLLAVSDLAVAVSGLQHLGADFYVEPLFDGVMLVLAVGLAEYARQRRERQMGGRRSGESDGLTRIPQGEGSCSTLPRSRRTPKASGVLRERTMSFFGF